MMSGREATTFMALVALLLLSVMPTTTIAGAVAADEGTYVDYFLGDLFHNPGKKMVRVCSLLFHKCCSLIRTQQPKSYTLFYFFLWRNRKRCASGRGRSSTSPAVASRRSTATATSPRCASFRALITPSGSSATSTAACRRTHVVAAAGRRSSTSSAARTNPPEGTRRCSGRGPPAARMRTDLCSFLCRSCS